MSISSNSTAIAFQMKTFGRPRSLIKSGTISRPAAFKSSHVSFAIWPGNPQKRCTLICIRTLSKFMLNLGFSIVVIPSIEKYLVPIKRCCDGRRVKGKDAYKLVQRVVLVAPWARHLSWQHREFEDGTAVVHPQYIASASYCMGNAGKPGVLTPRSFIQWHTL